MLKRFKICARAGENFWVVSYTYKRAPPAASRRAFARIMTEFTMDRNVPMLPDQDCLDFAYWYALILKQLRNIHLQLRFGTR